MFRRRSLSLLLGVCAGAGFAALQACGSSDDGSTFKPDSGVGGGDDGSSTYDSGGGLIGSDGSTGPHTDFPSTPIIDTPDGGTGAAPANSGTLFSGAGAAGDGGADAPCLVQSEVGSLLPRNWLRPRFGWQAGGGENLFELRVHADNQTNDLVVYTTATEWTMPQTMWAALAKDSAGVPMTVSVRGAVYASGAITGLAQGSSGPFGIAPVDAPGAIVYWHIIGGNDGELKGFNVGDEDVQLTLPATSVTEYSTTCIGCHVSTPDGKYAVFSSSATAPQWDDGIGAVSAEAGVGTTPSFLSTDAKTALQTASEGIMTTSIAHWAAGDYMVLASSNDNHSIQWTELDGVGAAASGTVPITGGDPNSNHTSPSWSHDGKTIAYTSAPQSTSGRPDANNNDIYMLPYNNKAGGAAAPLVGANSTANEYYPSFSPDDKWITFNRSVNTGGVYSVPTAEVYVTKADGSGTATRLAANDPPACANRPSPGITNSWPRWAPAKPAPQTVNGLTYYWVVFSSKRLDGSTPQLYMAPVVIDAAGNVKQYQAVYLWNQPITERNHTPAWDVFGIPPSPGGPPR
jgi:hypothetical protein